MITSDNCSQRHNKIDKQDKHITDYTIAELDQVMLNNLLKIGYLELEKAALLEGYNYVKKIADQKRKAHLPQLKKITIPKADSTTRLDLYK